MSYLLKVTIIWSILLILFEIAYKNKRKFVINRFILLFSITCGLVLPLIPTPSKAPALIEEAHSFYKSVPVTARLNEAQKNLVQATAPANTYHTAVQKIAVWPYIYTIYIIGAFLLLANCIIELYKIRRLVRTKPVHTIYGYKVVATGKPQAPYSFMSYIFLDDTVNVTPADLKYIIQHEAAHYESRHWLDLWIMQLFCIVFWFHPLIWRYRYLLRLQQEFEADDIASRDDAYHYGHFLLRQTLLTGVPSIAHSFHFSPIKNRIRMLTMKQGLKHGSKLYILLLPALLGCTLLMAKETDTSGANITTYHGHTFKWRQTDTLSYNREAKTVLLAHMNGRSKMMIIYSMNNEPVYRNEYITHPAAYGSSDDAYNDYVKDEFARLVKNTADSSYGISLSSLVIDKEGKVVNYRIHYGRRPEIAGFVENQDWNLFHDLQPRLDSIIEKIISEGPKWKPAMIDGKPVNTVVSLWEGC